MNVIQVTQVLAKIKIGDNRDTSSELIVREWVDNIGHLDFDDAIAAVTMHRQESTEYLQAAHIVANVKRIRAERAEKAASFALVSPPRHKGRIAPQPKNFAAMVAAHNDPEKFAYECAVYNRQLADEGYETMPEYGIA